MSPWVAVIDMTGTVKRGRRDGDGDAKFGGRLCEASTGLQRDRVVVDVAAAGLFVQQRLCPGKSHHLSDDKTILRGSPVIDDRIHGSTIQRPRGRYNG